MDPITLAAAAFAAGVIYRRFHPADPESVARDQLRKDKGRDRVLPASWEQECDIEYLARQVADRDGRDRDHVLCQYGAFTYAAGRTRTMIRKRLTRREAKRIIARIQKRERVELGERPTYDRDFDPLKPRDDEEAF